MSSHFVLILLTRKVGHGMLMKIKLRYLSCSLLSDGELKSVMLTPDFVGSPEMGREDLPSAKWNKDEVNKCLMRRCKYLASKRARYYRYFSIFLKS